MKGLLLPALLVFAPAPRATAVSVTFPINTNASTVKLTLQVAGKSDTQTGRLTGTLTADLDAVPGPGRIGIGDFAISLATPLNFKIDFGLGNGAARVESLKLIRKDPPASPERVPLAGGSFEVTNLVYVTSGLGDYKATGLVCSLLQAGGRPCADSVDFDSGPPAVIDSLAGTLVFADGRARLQAHYFFTQPLDPSNPDFATVVGEADVVAEAPLLALSGVQLTGIPTGKEVVLRWPKGPVEYQLQSSTEVANPSGWTPVTGTPVLKAGFYEITLPAGAQQQFFRLQ